jgi:hypothetical protein
MVILGIIAVEKRFPGYAGMINMCVSRIVELLMSIISRPPDARRGSLNTLNALLRLV